MFTRQQRLNKDKNNNGKCAISNTDDIVQTKMRHRSIQSHNLQLFWAIYAQIVSAKCFCINGINQRRQSERREEKNNPLKLKEENLKSEERDENKKTACDSIAIVFE